METNRRSMIRSIRYRLYEDFFMPSRMNQYEDLLKAAIDAGYEHITQIDFFRLVRNHAVDPNKKYFLHRHDIDTDLKTTRRYLNIEQKLQVRTSYYFRLLTLDYGLMREIHQSGSETGYHYEELATYCKQHHIKSVEALQPHLPQIREAFSRNFSTIEEKFGHKISSIASHGDFVNRKMNYPNHKFVDDALLSKHGIELECYNPQLLQAFGMITSDKAYPRFFAPFHPKEGIEKNIPVIYVLTHPRHWHTNWGANIAENFRRVWEGIRY